jgi:TolA-binding protein
LANQAEFDAARQAYNKAIHSPAGAKTETAAKAQLMIGETFFHQKNYEAALREYLRVEILYDYPNRQAAALLQAGRCRERLGEASEATKLYRKILKSYPNTSFAKDAAKELARLEAAASRR